MDKVRFEFLILRVFEIPPVINKLKVKKLS